MENKMVLVLHTDQVSLHSHTYIQMYTHTVVISDINIIQQKLLTIDQDCTVI